MRSLFEARIYHERLLPKINKFKYSGFYIKISIENIHDLESKFFSLNKFNLFSFYEKDHGYRDGSSLILWVSDTLSKAGIKNFSGGLFILNDPAVTSLSSSTISFSSQYPFIGL